jgi:hypothetical protein
VPAGDDQGAGDVPEPVGAPVSVVPRFVQTVEQPLVDAQVALEASAQGLLVAAVELSADVLPAGGDEDGARRVEHGETDVEGGGQAVAHALHAAEIDEAGQGVLGGSHCLPFPPLPTARRR